MCYLHPYYCYWHFSTIAIASCEILYNQKEEKTGSDICEGNMALPQRMFLFGECLSYH